MTIARVVRRRGAVQQGVSIPGVTGQVANGQRITINWDGTNGFGGTGPTIAHYDPMDTGSDSESYQTSHVAIGGDYLQTGGAVYSEEFSRFGTSSALLYDYRVSDVPRILRKNFSTSPIAKVRYWMYCPTGGALPDRTIGGFTSARSSMKIAWLAYDQDSFGNGAPPDICIPTLPGFQNVSLDGNSAMPGEWSKYPGNNNTNLSDIFDYGEWWLCEGYINGTTGRTRIRHLNSSKGLMTFSRTVADFFGSETPATWGTCNLVGYIRNEPDEPAFDGCRVYFNDYAIYTGSGADCDIYLGNASTFDAVTDLRHVIPVPGTWSNEQVQGDIYGCDNITLGDGWYLYMQDADGDLVPYFGSESRAVSG